MLCNDPHEFTSICNHNLIFAFNVNLNLFLTDEFDHHYHLDESTAELRYAASHLGLYCLLMSHKKDVRLIQA